MLNLALKLASKTPSSGPSLFRRVSSALPSSSRLPEASRLRPLATSQLLFSKLEMVALTPYRPIVNTGSRLALAASDRTSESSLTPENTSSRLVMLRSVRRRKQFLPLSRHTNSVVMTSSPVNAVVTCAAISSLANVSSGARMSSFVTPVSAFRYGWPSGWKGSVVVPVSASTLSSVSYAPVSTAWMDSFLPARNVSVRITDDVMSKAKLRGARRGGEGGGWGGG